MEAMEHQRIRELKNKKEFDQEAMEKLLASLREEEAKAVKQLEERNQLQIRIWEKKLILDDQKATYKE